MPEYRYKNQKWTEEMDSFLMAHKDMPRQEVFSLFHEKWPDISFTAMNNQRSRIGAVAHKVQHPSTRSRPLYSEHIKRGYVFVKVAEPSVWWSKAKFVYVATHPEEAGSYLETDCFYFLDGNNRNFDWKNIVRVHRKEQTVFQSMGGTVPGNPELTLLHLAQARLKLAMLDAGEDIPGTVVKTKSGRKFREERNKKANEKRMWRYHNDPEYRKKLKVWLTHAKPETKEKRKVYAREWARRKREALKQ